MNFAPLVSIIIPNYNYARYLRDAINSVLAQTYKSIEVIVIDDGSTDESRDVIAAFAGRIRSVVKDNGGLSSARNAGIGVARGGMLLFLDSDDILFPGAIEGLVSAYEVCGGNLVYGDSLYFNDSSEWPGKRIAPSGRIWRELLGGNFICCHEVLVPRRLAVDAGGFDESLRMSEDFDLWLRLARNHAFRHVSVPVARRRVHATMMSRQTDELQFWAGRVLQKQLNFAKGFCERLEIAKGCGRNLHLRAYLAKERKDFLTMRRFSLRALRWQPLRIKNWLYLGYAFLARCKRSASGE